MQLTLGLLLGMVIAVLAWRVGSLSNSGAIAAALSGGIIFGIGGLPWAILLILFFVSSSLLSRLFQRRKRQVEEKFSKGSRRDWAQVAANGSLGVVLAVMSLLLPGNTGVWWAFAGAMAAVNADTWATELGVLSPAPPRRLTTGEVVERGTSGGVSLAGTLAALAGAALIGAAAALFPAGTLPGIAGGEAAAPGLFLAAAAGGLLGALIDSLLGATVQAIYFCPQCEKETERHPQHSCGTPTRLLRGWRWLNNDWVNWICSLSGAAAALVGWLLLT
jgi:uncharacterized protein (TIGR00297 family)